MIKIAKRWVAIAPFLCSIVAFTMALVILTAGSRPGYMEDIAIIRLNISMIGANIFGAIGDIPGIDQFSDSLGGIKGLLGRRDDVGLVQRGLFDGGLDGVVSQIGDAVTSAVQEEKPTSTPTLTPDPSSTTRTKDSPATTTTTAAKNDAIGDILDGLPIPPDVKSKVGDVIPTAVLTSVEDITGIVDDVGNVIPGLGALIDKVNASIPSDIRDAVIGVLGDLQNFTGTLNLTDGLADELGLNDWYSLHLMGGCQGKYTPNPIAAGAGLNVTECTPTSLGFQLNLTEMLDRQLGIGPFHINLAQLQFPDAIQGGLDMVNNFSASIAYAYIFGIAMAGVNMAGSVVAFFLRARRTVAAVNVAAALLGTLALLGGSLVTMLISHGGGALINLAGKAVGVAASPGTTFVNISWASTVFMALGFVYWVVELTVARFRARVVRIRARVVAELAKEGRLREPEEMEELRRQEQGEMGEGEEYDYDGEGEGEYQGGEEGGYPRDEKAMMQQQLQYVDSNGGGYYGDGDYDYEQQGQQGPPVYDEYQSNGGGSKKKKKKKGSM